jgi:hypothetical protein
LRHTPVALDDRRVSTDPTKRRMKGEVGFGHVAKWLSTGFRQIITSMGKQVSRSNGWWS